jgi:GT2 family glycosyltransferase
MKLSILIINHNFSQHLGASISALNKAAKDINYELIVVANGSADESASIVSNLFPDAHLIVNESRQPISKAANQALQVAKGEYILLVTPDIIPYNDSLDKLLAFMDIRPNAGGLSVRLVTPMGRFIKESKFGLAKPWMNFFKYSGFHRFFPKSHLFSNKRADWVEEFETTEIDVLNGSCMLLRKSVLNRVGLLDERFKNYGYDIDLSYRIRLGGFKNYYFANTYLIRLTQHVINKFSLAYITQYYGAMIIFAGKYLFKMPAIRIKGIGELFHSSYEVKG